MNRTKRILILPLVFVLGAITSFFIQTPFARMVRYFYSTFTSHKLYFTGKYFRLVPGDTFILSFGIFCVLLTALLFRHTFKQGLFRVLLVVGLFFLSIAAISSFNASAHLITCTACANGRMAMRAGEVSYDAIFITGLSIAILPMLTSEIIKWVTKKTARPGFNQRQFI